MIAGELQESSTIWDVVKGFKDKDIERIITFNTYYLNKFSNLDEKLRFGKIKFFRKLAKIIYFYLILIRLLRFQKVDILYIEKPRIMNKKIITLLKKKINFIVSYSRDSLLKKSNKNYDLINFINESNIFYYTKQWQQDDISKIITNTPIKFYPHSAYIKKVINKKNKFYIPEKINIENSFLFVGEFESNRALILRSISEEFKVLVFGPGWSKKIKDKYSFPNNFRFQDTFLNRYKYLLMAQRSLASFCFFRKSVNDLFTDRPVELALNEVCIISEYSKYQEKIFRDKKECFYFKNSNELNELMKIIKKDINLAKSVGKSARERAVKLKLTTKDLTNNILQSYFEQYS